MGVIEVACRKGCVSQAPDVSFYLVTTQPSISSYYSPFHQRRKTRHCKGSEPSLPRSRGCVRSLAGAPRHLYFQPRGDKQFPTSFSRCTDSISPHVSTGRFPLLPPACAVPSTGCWWEHALCEDMWRGVGPTSANGAWEPIGVRSCQDAIWLPSPRSFCTQLRSDPTPTAVT